MKYGTNIKITNNDVLHGKVNRLLLKQNSQKRKTKQEETKKNNINKIVNRIKRKTKQKKKDRNITNRRKVTQRNIET